MDLVQASTLKCFSRIRWSQFWIFHEKVSCYASKTESNCNIFFLWKNFFFKKKTEPIFISYIKNFLGNLEKKQNNFFSDASEALISCCGVFLLCRFSIFVQVKYLDISSTFFKPYSPFYTETLFPLDNIDIDIWYLYHHKKKH